MTKANRTELEQLQKNLRELERRKKYTALEFFTPYAKQQEFFDLTLDHVEVLLRAGNQLGKTEAGAFMMAAHLTGRYPDWWLGRRWDRPIKAWAAGITGIQTRDVIQKKLIGEFGELGTGMIPRDCLRREDMSLARGISDLFDTIPVKHISGGNSILRLKTYEQGREKFQGDTLDLAWFDEEPPLDVYLETLARMTTTDGLTYITFTPIKGDTDVVLRFTGADTEEKRPQCVQVQMTARDCPHMTPERMKAALARYPEYQHAARINGDPMQGSGRVFPFPEEKISCAPFEIPGHWSLLWGVDFGLNHPFAAVLLAWDKDNDVIYVIHTLRMKDALPIDHVLAMKPRGFDIPVAWPQDGTQRKEFEGALMPLAKIYKKHGLRMQDEHARFSDGSNSTEVGVQEMQERMRTERFKVFNTEVAWFDEYRNYHRDEEGLLVKLRDDLMSATRICIMAKRGARIRERFVRQQAGASGVKMAVGAETGQWGA